MFIKYLGIALSSYLLSAACMTLFKNIAHKYNILMLKDIPLVGGLSMGGGF